MSKSLKFITSILVCEAVGLLATPFTISSIQTWYSTLNKPSFSPPNWVFGPVWTILYFMMGVAAYIIWSKGLASKKIRYALSFFLIQLFFNFLWSIIFFGLRSPVLAFINILLLWIFIFLTILKFHKISKSAAYLLIPYLIWVSFASILNFSIIILNS